MRAAPPGNKVTKTVRYRAGYLNNGPVMMHAPKLEPSPVTEWHNVTPKQFITEIAPRFEPAILRGYTQDWPAVTHALKSQQALREYLVGFSRGEPIELFLGAPEIGGRFSYDEHLQGFNFVRRKDHFETALQRLQRMEDDANPPAFYIGATAIPHTLPGLERDNTMNLVDERVPPNIWIGNRTTIPTHYDVSDNLACVVAGRRRFTLFPPEQVRNLYVGPIDFTPAGQPISLVDPYQPDLERFPKFAEAMPTARVAELEPGDVLYIPSLWWHQVESLARFNVLINYWWETGVPNTGSPFEALVHGLLTVRQLPLEKRRAWQTFFDHYLFSETDPAEHLSPEQRRALGEMTPELADYLKGFLRNALDRR
ncbi:cupin-like protein [Marinimicrobium koreense]|uniref:Cupin-like protein n=2 Tax=Cellvibrionaceae TaxID=1706371 RepID=A0A3N1P318_9GAMM|nr:cupin-like protein [Marinimicrobium koreense]